MRHSSCLQVVCNPSCNRSAESLRQGLSSLGTDHAIETPACISDRCTNGPPFGLYTGTGHSGPGVGESPSRPGSRRGAPERALPPCSVTVPANPSQRAEPGGRCGCVARLGARVPSAARLRLPVRVRGREPAPARPTAARDESKAAQILARGPESRGTARRRKRGLTARRAA